MCKRCIDLSKTRARSVPTRYANVTFRSKTEARWALFLDLLGITWKYEPQGFVVTVIKDRKIHDSFAYLPDFKISSETTWMTDANDATVKHRADWWLEVKGPEPTPRERYKCEKLSEAANVPVMLVSGGFSERPRSYIFAAGPQPTDLAWRWLRGDVLTADEFGRVTAAYREATLAQFEGTYRRPSRRKGLLRRVAVEV
jgi:hypothetical protein